MNLTTQYMGIELKNPVIIGANHLSARLSNLEKMEQNGAAGIVFKSLFEEQLHFENLMLGTAIEEYSEIHPEITSPAFDLDFSGPKEYIYQLKKARKALKNIPLFASLNAVYDESWVDYALKIEKTGVQGIELNFYTVPRPDDFYGMNPEDRQSSILHNLKQALKIPVAVKLSPYSNNMVGLVRKMDSLGANAFVLFNRFFQPDIDIEKETLHFPYNLSQEGDYKLSMRFAGMLYKNIDAQICASGGVFNGHDIAKLVMAGADATQITSVLYKNGLGSITQIINELTQWMESKGYSNLDAFKGKLSHHTTKDDFVYSRAQYLDLLLNSKEMNKYLPQPVDK